MTAAAVITWLSFFTNLQPNWTCQTFPNNQTSCANYGSSLIGVARSLPGPSVLFLGSALLLGGGTVFIRIGRWRYEIKPRFITLIVLTGLLSAFVVVPSYYAINTTYPLPTTGTFSHLNYVLTTCPNDTSGCGGSFLFCSTSWCPTYTTVPYKFTFSLGQNTLLTLSMLSVFGSVASYESARKAWNSKPRELERNNSHDWIFE